jgi:hypothetical protein
MCHGVVERARFRLIYSFKSGIIYKQSFQKVQLLLSTDPELRCVHASFPEDPNELLYQFRLDNYEKMQ